MHVANSTALRVYLDAQGMTQADLDESELLYKRLNRLTWIGNLIHVTRGPWIALVGLAGCSLLASTLSGWGWPLSITLSALVIAWAIGFFTIDGVVTDTEKMLKDLSAHASLGECEELLLKLARELELNIDIVLALSADELRSTASNKLYALANEIRTLEKKGENPYSVKYAFRETHAIAFKLGLVPPTYDRYFQE